MTVGQLENEMTVDEYLNWRAFLELEPISNQAEDLKNDYRFALLAVLFHNAFTDQQHQAKLEDFLPHQPVKKQNWQKQYELCQIFTSTL